MNLLKLTTEVRLGLRRCSFCRDARSVKEAQERKGLGATV